MKIVVVDYSGHPFQVQLSREFANRGHEVLHLYFAEFQTPKGRLVKESTDASTLAIEPISLGKPFEKYNFLKRRNQEISLGRRFSRRIGSFCPDVIIASNLPLDALRTISKAFEGSRSAFIFWQQDIYSVAIERILTKKFGLIGRWVGRYYKAMEQRVLNASDAVVVISADFLNYATKEFYIDASKVHVVENWAPVEEIKSLPKDNSWSRANGLAETELVLYTGTLGLKHDPKLLLELASALQNRPNAQVIVASEGPAADWLAANARALALKNIQVIGFQPYEVYAQVLAAADVLVSILEADSGVFSVPSKVLSYLCAGRTIVLSSPEENLASRIIMQSGAGTVVSPGRPEDLAKVVREYLDAPSRRQQAANSARDYAEKTFRIDVIGSAFESVIRKARESKAEKSAWTRADLIQEGADLVQAKAGE
jgi:glycosyltransferase involved in cell wall biosynthesis